MTLPRRIRLANRALAGVARRWWPLRPEPMLRSARWLTGVRELGDDFPVDLPLDRLCGSLREVPGLHPLGRRLLQHWIIDDLWHRFQLQSLVGRRPEILDRPVDPPLVIAGSPGGATALVQRMLARDPALRATPLWLQWGWPLDGPGSPAKVGTERDWRVRHARRRVRRWVRIAPELASLYGTAHDEPDADSSLLGFAFVTLDFEALFDLPAFTQWYESTDHTPGYRLLRRVLQLLQGPDPPSARWLLQDPLHLEQLVPLSRVFPDATVVYVHRDPVDAVVAMSAAVSYGSRLYLARPDPMAIGRRCADLVERQLRAAQRDRDATDLRFVDVDYEALRGDPLTALGPVYETAGLELRPEAAERMIAWLLAHRDDGYATTGGHRPEDFGLDAEELRERFQFTRS